MDAQEAAAAHFTFKVSIVGDRHTGKSNFLRCLRDFAPGASQSKPAQLMSNGINRCRLMYSMSDVLFDVRFEDAVTALDDVRSAGRSMANSAAAVVVFDITRRSSFEHVPDWVRLCRSYGKHARVVLVGTRHRLKKRRSVAKREAREVAAVHGCAYVELSVEAPGDNSTSAKARLYEQVRSFVHCVQHMSD